MLENDHAVCGSNAGILCVHLCSRDNSRIEWWVLWKIFGGGGGARRDAIYTMGVY